MFEEPSVYISGIRIDEPITTLTDLLVAGVCFFAFLKLISITGTKKLYQYLKFFFLFMGISTTLGGLLGHGFLYLFDPIWVLPGWIAGMIAIALLEQASIEHARKHMHPVAVNLFTLINIIELLSLIIITLITKDFLYVFIHTAFGLLIVVTTLNIYVWSRTRDTGSKWFIMGVGTAAVSVPFFISGWSIHPHFNHFCICHILTAISSWILYIGARKIVIAEDI